jgi:hypothetical protein
MSAIRPRARLVAELAGAVALPAPIDVHDLRVGVRPALRS